MNRRDFLKRTAALAAAAALPDVAKADEALQALEEASGQARFESEAAAADGPAAGKLIVSAPMLQNYAATSMGCCPLNGGLKGQQAYSLGQRPR